MVACKWIVFYVILQAEQNLSPWGQESISWSWFSSNQTTLTEVLLFLTATALFGHGFKWDSVICGACGPFMLRVKWWGTGSSVFMFDPLTDDSESQELVEWCRKYLILISRTVGAWQMFGERIWATALTGPDLLDRTSLDQRWCFVMYSSVDLPTLSASFSTNDTQVGTRHCPF